MPELTDAQGAQTTPPPPAQSGVTLADLITLEPPVVAEPGSVPPAETPSPKWKEEREAAPAGEEKSGEKPQEETSKGILRDLQRERRRRQEMERELEQTGYERWRQFVEAPLEEKRRVLDLTYKELGFERAAQETAPAPIISDEEAASFLENASEGEKVLYGVQSRVVQQVGQVLQSLASRMEQLEGAVRAVDERSSTTSEESLARAFHSQLQDVSQRYGLTEEEQDRMMEMWEEGGDAMDAAAERMGLPLWEMVYRSLYFDRARERAAQDEYRNIERRQKGTIPRAPAGREQPASQQKGLWGAFSDAAREQGVQIPDIHIGDLLTL